MDMKITRTMKYALPFLGGRRWVASGGLFGAGMNSKTRKIC